MISVGLRILWNGLAFVSLGLGLFGVVTPGFPGTVFLVVALYFFGKGSNDKWRHWMLNHHRFGGVLRDWDETRSISLGVKWLSCSCIVFFSGLSVMMMIAQPMVQVLISVLAVVGVAYLVTRKTSVRSMTTVMANSVDSQKEPV